MSVTHIAHGIINVEDSTITTDCFISANSGDLAHNKPAIQTTDYSSSWVAGKALDGDFSSYSCTVRYDNSPYWSVDLGMDAYVDHLYITNVQSRNGELSFSSTESNTTVH